MEWVLIYAANRKSGCSKRLEQAYIKKGVIVNGVMDYNWLGVAFVSDDLPVSVQRMVEDRMDELEAKVNREFDQWLEKSGLERVMGVIVKLGTV